MKTTFQTKVAGASSSLTFQSAALAVAALLLLAGCAVGPDYQTRPDLTVSEIKQPIDGETISHDEIAAWWHVFNDATLTALIDQSLASNRTLRAATAGVRAARARLTISQAGLLPTLDAGGGYSRFRNSNYAAAPGHGGLYQAGFDASWELDVFGRRHRAIEAAEAELEAEYATLENVWTTLAAETALAYVQLQTARRQLDVAATNLLVQSDSLDLVASRARSGLANGLAEEQARYIMEQTRATIPRLLAQEEAALNTLAALVGTMPGELGDSLSAIGPIPEAAPRTLVGIPAELLRRRPDVRAAERRLAAQTARIGEATADLYPTFRLGGSVGLESLHSGNFLDWKSRFWSIAPRVTWPIFHGGSIRANIEVQTALQEQALANYEQTVLNAVAELRSALAAYGREFARRDTLLTAQDAAQQAVNISQDLFKQGLADFNNVLDAQRSLLSFGEAIAASDGLIAENLIRVYKALGGGWQPLYADQAEELETFEDDRDLPDTLPAPPAQEEELADAV